MQLGLARGSSPACGPRASILLCVCWSLWQDPCDSFSTQVAWTVGSKGGLQFETEQRDDIEQRWSVDAGSTPARESRGNNPLDVIPNEGRAVQEGGNKGIKKSASGAQDAVNKSENVGKTIVDRGKNTVDSGSEKIADNGSGGIKKAVGIVGGPAANQTQQDIDDAADATKGGIAWTTNKTTDAAHTGISKTADVDRLVVNYSRDAMIVAWNTSTHPFAVIDNDETTTEAGNSKVFINVVVVCTLAFIAASMCLGYIIDKGAFPSMLTPKNRPSAMTISLLIASYALLVPGVTSFIFSYNIVINDGDWIRLGVTVDNEGNPGPCTESAWSLMHRLFADNNVLGAFFLFFYAILVPCIKVVALMFDMFAYILFNHLLRNLHQPPELESVGHLDVGFDFFSVFCVLSTFAALGIRPPPEKPHEGAAPILAAGTFGLRTVISGLTCMFWICLVLGASRPCLCMRLDERSFDKLQGPAKAFANIIIDDMSLIERMSADVSILGCSVSLVRWVLVTGEVNLVFALVLLAGFAVVVPVWHMTVLLKVAYQQDVDEAAIDSAAVLNHIAMLDVCIMGVAVVVLCSGVYKEQGLALSLGYGFALLLAAEVVRYVAHYMILDAARRPMGDFPAGLLLRRISNKF